jgi:hypothetical protein
VTLRPIAIADALARADADGPVLCTGVEVLTGFSGKRLIGSLQRLAALLVPEESCYLEIGVFQGLTLLSVAASRPELECIGVDNFSQFDADGRNRVIVEDRRRRLRVTNARLVDADYEVAFEEALLGLGKKRLGLYFVDGPHDYRAQRMCLDLALPYLATDAIIVVDDANYPHVRQANHDFLRTQADFRLIFEAYTRCHPSNMSSPEAQRNAQGWWNGVHVLIRDASRGLADQWPPTDPDRRLYENDHIIHASNIGEATPDVIDLMQPLFLPPTPRNLVRSARGLFRLLGHRWRIMRSPRYRAANTYSASLPATRIHPQLAGDSPRR